MKRRLLAVALAFAVAAALIVPVHVLAQSFQMVGPGSIIYEARSSVTLTNSTTATTMCTYPVPAGWATYPIHARLTGTLTTAVATGASTANIGVNFGTTASIAMANATSFTANLSGVPFAMDILVKPTTLASTSPVLTGRMWQGAADTIQGLVAQTAATSPDPTGQPTLSVIWQWASATTTNSVTILNCEITLGN